MKSGRDSKYPEGSGVSDTPRANRIGYVVKMYPRYSETFIVSEILAHEAAGLDLEIFSLRPPVDAHFQNIISRVKSPVAYIPSHTPDSEVLWDALTSAGSSLPGFWGVLGRCGKEPVKNVYQAVLLAQLLRSRGITHVHAHFASLATTVGRMASAFAGLPYTFTVHAKDLFHDSVDLMEFSRKLQDAEATVTVSDYNLRFLLERHGTAAKKVHRIYNGLHLDQFSFKSPAPENQEIIAVGRLVEKKGFRDLISACGLMRDAGQNVHCSIVGSGALEPELRAQITHMQLEDHVKLLGPLPQNEVIAMMRNARVLAAPCVDGSDGNREGLPTVLIEAMALGTPCVATSVTGIPEIVVHEQTGLLTAPHDVTGLADALARLLGDDRLCVRLAANARTLVEDRFDAHRNTAVLRSLFASGHLADEAAA